MDISSERTEYLEFLRQLFENKNYNAVIDKVFPMKLVVDAHKYVDTGRKKRECGSKNIFLNRKY